MNFSNKVVQSMVITAGDSAIITYEAYPMIRKTVLNILYSSKNSLITKTSTV